MYVVALHHQRTSLVLDGEGRAKIGVLMDSIVGWWEVVSAFARAEQMFVRLASQAGVDFAFKQSLSKLAEEVVTTLVSHQHSKAVQEAGQAALKNHTHFADTARAALKNGTSTYELMSTTSSSRLELSKVVPAPSPSSLRGVRPIVSGSPHAAAVAFRHAGLAPVLHIEAAMPQVIEHIAMLTNNVHERQRVLQEQRLALQTLTSQNARLTAGIAALKRRKFQRKMHHSVNERKKKAEPE
jgi:hypothetical protein